MFRLFPLIFLSASALAGEKADVSISATRTVSGRLEQVAIAFFGEGGKLKKAVWAKNSNFLEKRSDRAVIGKMESKGSETLESLFHQYLQMNARLEGRDRFLKRKGGTPADFGGVHTHRIQYRIGRHVLGSRSPYLTEVKRHLRAVEGLADWKAVDTVNIRAGKDGVKASRADSGDPVEVSCVASGADFLESKGVGEPEKKAPRLCRVKGYGQAFVDQP